MRKFKLIKKYPGSPKLGTTYQEIEGLCPYHGKMYKNLSKEGACLLASEIENHPEFWEEVVEKNYEILSFTCNNKKLNYNKNLKSFNYENNDGDTHRTLKFILKNPNTYKIHSVKRLSDGEIFTIGDKVFSEYVNYTINKISIVNDKCMVSALYDINNPNGSRLHYNLNNLKKAKQPLFTTEDGVDIFEGNVVYYVETEEEPELCFIVNEYTVLKYPGRFISDKSLHSFSTKEKAEEYILMNKPVLSLNDIFKDVEEMRKGLKTFENSQLAKRFKKLVQQKLNK